MSGAATRTIGKLANRKGAKKPKKPTKRPTKKEARGGTNQPYREPQKRTDATAMEIGGQGSDSFSYELAIFSWEYFKVADGRRCRKKWGLSLFEEKRT